MDRRVSDRGLRFDGTINAGNLIAIAALLWAILSAWGNVDKRLAAVEMKVDPVWKAFTDHGRSGE